MAQRQKMVCVSRDGYGPLKEGEECWFVEHHEPVHMGVFTWPAYTTVETMDGVRVDGHSSRFKPVEVAQ